MAEVEALLCEAQIAARITTGWDDLELPAATLQGLWQAWKNAPEIASQWRVERRFEPKLSRDRAQAMREQWRRAVERAKGWEQAR
jgi:glycerol kinase